MYSRVRHSRLLMATLAVALALYFAHLTRDVVTEIREMRLRWLVLASSRREAGGASSQPPLDLPLWLNFFETRLFICLRYFFLSLHAIFDAGSLSSDSGGTRTGIYMRPESIDRPSRGAIYRRCPKGSAAVVVRGLVKPYRLWPRDSSE